LAASWSFLVASSAQTERLATLLAKMQKQTRRENGLGEEFIVRGYGGWGWGVELREG